MGKTNYDIVPAAKAGKDAKTTTGNFSTDHYRREFPRMYAPYTGHLPARLERILHAAFREGRISQVIYSYSTPIAWLDGDTWIVPDVTYSATTSSKHQSQLWKLSNVKYVPWDAGQSEYAQILAGATVYTRRYGKPYGTYKAA